MSTKISAAVRALRDDLINADGPRISTMRNYRYAILQYDPKDEFFLRQEIQRLTDDLVTTGWVVLPINLQKLLFDRVRFQGSDWATRVAQQERVVGRQDPDRGLNYLSNKLAPMIMGPEGLAADCSKIICDFIDANPDRADRTVAIIGRAGSLYPFFRSSALLRHLDGHTRQVPVILLYPGERRTQTGLSFMGLLEPDQDYRPRIYS